MSVYHATVQLHMSGFEIRRFCERLSRAARHTVRPGPFVETTALCAMKHDVIVPHTCTSSVAASGYYCTLHASLPGRGFRRETSEMNKLQS